MFFQFSSCKDLAAVIRRLTIGPGNGALRFGLSAGALPALAPRRAVLWAVWMAGLAWPAALPAAEPPSPYVALYRAIVAQHAPEKTYSLAETVAVGEAAARLWRRTHEPACRDAAVRYFQAVLAKGKPDLRDFHPLLCFSRLAWLLKQEGLVPAQCDPLVREIAVAQLQAFIQSPDDGDYNIRLAQVLADACLLKYLGDATFPQRAAAQRRLDVYWSKIIATGDLDEDAANYDSFGAMLLLELARETGRENDVRQSPGLRRMLSRFRDIVSPTGLIPEYGDSYFSYTTCPLDRLYVLECAARLYDDPTYLAAARQMDQRPGLVPPGLDLWYRGQGLIDLPASRLTAAELPGSPSLVTYRARRGQQRPLVDKLILRTGRRPGAAMVMMDLYASGSHAHREKGPSIAFYECDGVPLFHNMGRHQTRSAIAGNLVWAMPPGRPFPGLWQEEQWFTMSIPATYLDRQDDGYRIPAEFSLRNFRERSACTELCFDNLRLEGPAGARVLDDFEEPKRWAGALRSRAAVSLSEDHTQGKAAECVAWKSLPSGYFNRKLPPQAAGVFQAADYRYLKWDLKFRGARPYAHIHGLGQQVDLGDQLLEARIEGADAQQRDHDACGRVRYASYITPDTRLTRCLVLTAEGYLVLRDVLVAGREMDGWNAGPLWQLYERKSQGHDWFCSDDDGPYPLPGGRSSARAMFVRFASDRAADVGCAENRQPYHCPTPKNRRPEHFWTTFQSEPVHSGGRATFATIVVPHDPASVRPEELAKQVALRIDPQGNLHAAVTSGAKALEIFLGDDAWTVTRRP